MIFKNFSSHARSQRNLYIVQIKLFTTRWPHREMTGHTENGHFTEPPYITLQTKQTMTVAEQVVLNQTLALLPPPLTLEEFLNVSIQQFEIS